MIWLATYVLTGALVGFLAGLLGIGGGMTLVPILAALFTAQGLTTDHNVHMALATAMASAALPRARAYANTTGMARLTGTWSSAWYPA